MRFYRTLMLIGVLGSVSIGSLAMFPDAAVTMIDAVSPKPITNISVINPRPTLDGLMVTYAFTKNRCKFKEVIWYDPFGNPQRVQFPKANGGWELPEEYINRTKGQQIVPQALLPGILELEGTRGVAVHICGAGSHERLIETQMYP